jgi:hypothetical protein
MPSDQAVKRTCPNIKDQNEHVGFRFPHVLVEALRKSAEKNTRTFSNEVIYRLLNSFKEENNV